MNIRTHTFKRCGAQIFIIEVFVCTYTHTPIFKAIIKQVLRFRFLSFSQKKKREREQDDEGDEDEEMQKKKKKRMIYLWQF